MTDDATPREVGSHAGLGLAPEREGQPRLYTATGPVPEAGHWYSPAAVRELLAAERERAAPLDVELQEVLDWARKEKAPLREQEIARIVRVLAKFRA